jgi:hypothetical protein
MFPPVPYAPNEEETNNYRIARPHLPVFAFPDCAACSA